VTPRAVVFDLWETLVPWPLDESERLRRSWAELLGTTVDRIDAFWYGDPDAYRLRETSPLGVALEALRDSVGGSGDVEALMEARVALARRALRPTEEVQETLRELRARGFRVGLISNCTEDVAMVWHEGVLGALVDEAIFSATAACMKPDARIYRLVCDGLGVEPGECLFVGDGANDELAGAARSGMSPVLFAPGGVPRWETLVDWQGVRIERIPDVLRLVP
jgi:putative hydrolase of the HAD superfamily